MKKIVLFATVCGLGLVAAAPSSNGGYPPCSATVTDRCIQLYERGVATRANLALNEQLGQGSTQMAMGGPYEPVEHESAQYEPVGSQDEYAGNWSDHPQEADGTDVLSADDVAGEAYSENAYGEEPEYAEDWSGYEDQSGY